MYAVIYIPAFSLQAALRLEPELHCKPVALIDEQLTKPVVIQSTVSAEQAGVTEGLTSTQALARCPQIIFRSRSSSLEAGASEALLHAAYAFSPRIEATAQDACTLDIKGWRFNSAAGFERFGSQIISALSPLNLAGQVGIAPTPLLAFHAARRADPYLQVERPDSFIRSLPIKALEPGPKISHILKKWGIRTAGDFLRLSREEVTARLGPEALELFKRASTQTFRPLNLFQPSETFEETFDFENPVESLQPLLFIVRRFLEQLSHRLALSGFVAETLFLRLLFAETDPYERLFRIPSPTREVDTLFRMVHTHLETLKTADPIQAIKLAVAPSPSQQQQLGLFENTLRNPNAFYEMLGRLGGLLGADRIGRPEPVAIHRPDAFKVNPITLDDFEKPSSPSESPIPAPNTTGLPLQRFRPPLIAQVQIRNTKPASVKSARINGAIHCTRGPWRTSGAWWDSDPWDCEEWDVQLNDGTLCRLCRQNSQWYIEGLYD